MKKRKGLNKENMLKVADAIERRQVADNKIGFNMRSYVEDRRWGNWNTPLDANGSMCGTTACVAGFASLLERAEKKLDVIPKNEAGISYHDIGQRYLGLTAIQAEALFLDSVGDFNENNPLVPDALRYMALTGRVNWRKAIEVAKCVKEQSV